MVYSLRLSSSLDVAELVRRGLLHNKTSLVANVTATDYGKPRLSSQITVIINIIDINEENPYFNSTFYNVQLTENSQKATFVTHLTAVKTSVSSRLTYSFTTAQNSYFKIDEITVRVSLIHIMQVLVERFKSINFCFYT